MSIFGRLATMPLADLLQWLSLTRRTGILALDRGAIHKELFFHEGALISASSTDPREYLSQFLLMHEKVTEKELTRLYHHLQENGGKLGRLMLEINLITPDELQHFLRLKVEESIFDCFLWQDGAFHFFIDEPTSNEHLPIVSELNALTLEGMRRADEWRRIRKVVPDGPVLARLGGKLPDSAPPRARQLYELLSEDARYLIHIGLELHWPDFYLYEAAAELQRLGAIKLDADLHAERAAAAVPTEADRIDRELTLATDAMAHKDYDTARGHLMVLLRESPHHPAAQELLRRVAEKEAHSAAGNLPLSAVPAASRKLKKAEIKKLSPVEQYLIARIDGQRNIGDLVHISPLRETEVKELIAGFAASGLVTIGSIP
jgi:hypothetical protein